MSIFSKETLKPFDWFLILGIIILNLIYSFLQNEIDVIGSLASITGVVCVVLVAKRSLSNYIFGVVNVSLYAYISYKSALYGDFALNALYYLPMQFIGWAMWAKERGSVNSSGSIDNSLVKSHKMSGKERVIWSVASLLSVLLVGYLLDIFTEDPQPYKDSATTVLSIIAMFLLAKKYMEQWVLWSIANVISVVMWVLLWSRGDEHAVLMVIMWVFYLANSINGLIVWNKAATEPRTTIKY